MVTGYISTLIVKDEDGDARAVIDYHEERDVAERRCSNLADVGRDLGVDFDLVLRRDGEVVRSWTNVI